MEPFPFERLPLELKIKIIRETMTRLIVPEYFDELDLPCSFAEQVWVVNLLLSCREIRSIVKRIRKVVAFAPGVACFSLDPTRDTLTVWDMSLPGIESTKDWDPAASGLDRHALPILSLMTLCGSIKTPENIGRSSYWFGTPPNVYTQWSEVSFSTSLPVFSYLPLIQELVLSIEQVGSEWNIESFQMFGPDIVAPRESDEAWGLARVGPHDKNVAEYFVRRGIPADTGREWRFPNINPWRTVDSISDSIDTQIDRNHIDTPQSTVTPRIGFYGFSRGTMSLGGKWAGFRYFTETNEVHFSPLAWSEVEFFVRRYYTPDGYVIKTPGSPHPQLIARVWLIRPGNKAEPSEPHHCWLKVKKWEEGDPDWVSQVETMWKMVRAHLLVRNSVGSYRLCVADDS